ncbi:MAG: SDR family NAD(P)-dependent oxidoreductase [Candidatus Kapaibacteriota bacterium]|jgi:NAD(P)-dependent dehydrogenase (short-subunit alcohol dehydrogenase family)
MARFDNKVVFLTGGATGIGRATAEAFAREGASVAVCDVAEAPAQETVQRITNAGGKAIFIKTNVASSEEVQSAVKVTIEQFGGLHIGINNAGVEGSRDKATHDYDETVFRQVIDVNLTGVFLCMKAQIQAMLASKTPGAIVNTASFLGHFGMPFHIAYVASKHAVMGMSRAAGIEYARYGIRVNAICPGFIDTPMTAAHNEKDQAMIDRYYAAIPAKRVGQPEDIAKAILFLASEDAGYVYGQGLIADGGMSAI